MFIPPAVALLFGEFVKVGAGGCTRPQLETLLLWPYRAGKAPGAQPGLNGTGRSWLPASRLQRAGLGREKGTGSGARRVGTCLRVSRERERHLGGRSNTKEPRCISGGYLDFTILKTSLLFKTQTSALKDVGWSFPYMAVPILGLCCSRPPPSCFAARLGRLGRQSHS